MRNVSPEMLSFHLLLLFIVPCRIWLAFAFPSLSSSSPSPGVHSLADNGPFDQFRMPLTNDRSSHFPGVHVFPRALNDAQGFVGRGTAPGAMDLETWSKSQAVQLNQQNAVVSQLAQMAPQRRNQLAREMANGNATAADELIKRLMRDLAESQHGLMAFPNLAFMADPQMQAMAVDPAMMAPMRTTTTGGGLALSRQIPLAQQRQFLLNSGGLPPVPNTFQTGTAFNSAGTLDQSNFEQFNPSFATSRDRFQPLNSQIPSNPFTSNGDSSADLSRPNSLFSSASSFNGHTQIRPFSQSFPSSNNGKFVANNEPERTLSAAGGVQSAQMGRDTFRDFARKDGPLSTNGQGFVDEVMTMDEFLGRRIAAARGAGDTQKTQAQQQQQREQTQRELMTTTARGSKGIDEDSSNSRKSSGRWMEDKMKNRRH